MNISLFPKKDKKNKSYFKQRTLQNSLINPATITFKKLTLLLRVMSNLHTSPFFIHKDKKIIIKKIKISNSKLNFKNKYILVSSNKIYLKLKDKVIEVNNNFFIKSINTNKLENKEIREICLLKNQHWKFGIKKQLEWFKINIKKHDTHNMFYIKSKLVGYTLLREKICKVNKTNKEIKYLLFDTLIINKKHQDKKLSNLLMNFNNLIIKQKKLFSFLICNDELVNFYKKNYWVKLNNKNINVVDHKFNSNGMVYNNKNLDKRYSFYIEK